MIEHDALAKVTHALDATEIPYMVTGSFASTLHGVARTTHDIDVVIDPSPDSLAGLLDRLENAGFYLSRANARNALSRRAQLNVIEIDTAWKIDLIIRKDRPFSRTELTRRIPARIGEHRIFIASPEDTILAKLEWAVASNSQRQIEDIKGILTVKGRDLDDAYLDHWAGELGLRSQWEKIKSDHT